MFPKTGDATLFEQDRANDQSATIISNLNLPVLSPPDLQREAPELCETVIRDEWNSLPHSVIGLVAIDGTRVASRTFPKSDLTQAVAWIKDRQADRCSVYFHQGDVPLELGSTRAKKDDVTNAHFLWCDIDIGPESTRETEREQAKQRIEAFEQEFGVKTGVEDSGNGFYVKIRLNEPSCDRECVEQLNNCLIEKLGGDRGTQDFGRILGFPGTVNFPSHRKRTAGRQPRLRNVLKKTSASYSLTELEAKLAPARIEKKLTHLVPNEKISIDDLAVSPSFREVIREGNRLINPFLKENGSTDRSRSIWFAICEGIACGLTDQEIAGLFLNKSYQISERVTEKGGLSYIEAEINRARKETESLSCNPATPLPCAKLFRRYCFDNHLYSIEGVFYAWNGRIYDEINECSMRAELTEFFSRQHYIVGEKRKAFNLTKGKLNELLEALRNISHFETESFPKWLSARDRKPDERNLLICRNFVIDMTTGHKFAHTPELLSPYGVDYSFDPHGECPEWIKFLDEVIPDASDRACFQEICGYALTPDTSRHKIFYLYGPPRSGKSTALRVIERLAGKHNCVSKSTHQLGGEFSRQDLVGKLVCVITDSRINQIKDKASILELFLSVSGEDSQSINRKHEKHWNGRLPTRFIMASNELPQFSDSGTALAKRMIVLAFPNTFYGNEDLTLESRLLAELPGILNWAMEGKRRLEKRGRFTESLRSKEFQRDIEDMSSPLREFIDTRCEIDPHGRVTSKELYDDYKDWWQREMGQQQPMSQKRFANDLRSADTRIQLTRPYDESTRKTVRGFAGIRLRREKDVSVDRLF